MSDDLNEESPPTTAEESFRSATLMTEIGLELKERCELAEKYLDHLKILLTHANKAIMTLQSTSKYSLQQARKLLASNHAYSKKNPRLRNDIDRLVAVIDSQLTDFDDINDVEWDGDWLQSPTILEKLKLLESRQKVSDFNIAHSSSNKSVKCDVDEKYPENWSKDSSIDLNNVVNLPPVPEDVFTAFSSATKPTRSSSLSSLKSMRKVKLFLQRAETSDEDDLSSDNEEHDFTHKEHKGDSDESPKKYLGNIKEETHDHGFL